MACIKNTRFLCINNYNCSTCTLCDDLEDMFLKSQSVAKCVTYTQANVVSNTDVALDNNITLFTPLCMIENDIIVESTLCTSDNHDVLECTTFWQLQYLSMLASIMRLCYKTSAWVFFYSITFLFQCTNYFSMYL